MSRATKRVLAVLCVFLVAAPPMGVDAVEEFSTEEELESFLAEEGDHELIVVCTVPPGPKWDEERQMIQITEAFFTERSVRRDAVGGGEMEWKTRGRDRSARVVQRRFSSEKRKKTTRGDVTHIFFVHFRDSDDDAVVPPPLAVPSVPLPPSHRLTLK